MVMAHNLAASIELLTAAIQAIPSDRLGQSDAERLAASLDTSFDVLRQIPAAAQTHFATVLA